jgi:hypothetical protein
MGHAMLKSTQFAAIVSTLLVISSTGCSQGESSQSSSPAAISPTVSASSPSPSVAPTLSPDSLSPSESERFQEALDTGMGAATITQSASSKDDWRLVINRWQAAIDLLKTVSKSSPNYATAQKKIAEYRQNLAYAQQQTNRVSPSPKKAIAPVASKPSQPSPIVATAPNPPQPSSVTPEVALAMHLRQTGAKLYGTYWCSYCKQQKALFGSEAFSRLDYIECDPAGQNARTNLCQQANVRGFPTWEVNGKRYPGLRTLPELAELSGYQGDRNFQS